MQKPEIDFPDFDPPADLVITDLTVGDGEEAAAGQTVSVHYVGVAHSTGEEFDASYNRGEPLRFRLGIGQVIQGWDEGVMKMSLGEKATLLIGPDYAYGPSGNGPIPPNARLKFEVELLKIERAVQRGARGDKFERLAKQMVLGQQDGQPGAMDAPAQMHSPSDGGKWARRAAFGAAVAVAVVAVAALFRKPRACATLDS